MATVTFEIPDTLAQYAEEQGVLNPDWFSRIMRSALRRLDPALADKRKQDAEEREHERNRAAWEKFMTELKEIKDEPLGDDMPPRIQFREFPL